VDVECRPAMYVRMMVCNFTTVDYNISLFVSLFAASSSCELMVFFSSAVCEKIRSGFFSCMRFFYFQMIFRKKFAISKW